MDETSDNLLNRILGTGLQIGQAFATKSLQPKQSTAQKTVDNSSQLKTIALYIVGGIAAIAALVLLVKLLK